MVLNCVAFGCSNVHDAKKQISFHTFPFKRPGILKLWITALRRENWYPSRTSRLCGHHFLETDYQVRPGCTLKLLKPDAVPSVFSFPQHLMKKAVQRKTLIRNTPNVSSKVEAEAMDTDLDNAESQLSVPSTSTSTQLKVLVNAETQTSTVDKMVFLLRRKVKTLKQKVRRRDVQILNMKDLINEIKKSGHSNENLDTVLKNYFEGLPLELVLLQKKKNALENPGQRRYSALMKQFAHTLYFYSPKAYNFLRQQFVLPNGRTIRRWLCSVNCQPGILLEVLDFLKGEVKKQSHLKQCALIVDGMSIRKQVLWDDTQGKFTGNVDYGGIVDVDFEMAASEALFFQIVSYTNNFKCPVAYFLINKADADLQTQLINSCLRSLYDIGISIKSITADGTQTNIATYNKLGCNINADKMISHFLHPCAPTNVYCMLDTCHMLKLARNTFAEKNLHSNAGKISWEYLKKLDQVQQSEQLRLANSLTSHHVNYKNKVMNVKLAAQALSSGVADAIEYLKNSGVTEFKESFATIEFIRIVDKIFDILNCRNPYGKGYKTPIRPNTLKYFEQVFSEATKYLKTLVIDGVPLICHNRKTFAIGFILTMESTLGLVNDLFNLEENPLKYFLSYKCSQDHLELFFSCIRSRGGWNNNPNSQQLKWSLRQLLFKNSVTAGVNANCVDFGNYCTPAFEFRSEDRYKQNVAKSEDVDEINSFIQLVDKTSLTDFQENIIYYFSGYIVRNLVNRLTCNYCVDILLYANIDSKQDHLYCASERSFTKFSNFVTRGGLIDASNIVYQIVNFTEREFRCLPEKYSLLNNKTNIKFFLINTAINNFSTYMNLFVPKHPVVQEFLAEDLHEIQLIRKIIDVFLKCRMNHHSKLLNFKLHGNAATVRQKLTKLVLFKNC